MQTTVSSTGPAIARAGLLSDASHKRTRSAVNAEVSAEMRFGIMVGKGAALGQCLLLAASTDVCQGIVVFDHAYHKDLEAGDTGLKPDTTATLLREGVIWVQYTGTAPAEGDGVHVRCDATGPGEIAGTFAIAKDGTDTINLSKLAQWTGRTGSSHDGVTIAELEINMTMLGNAAADS